MTKGSFMLVLAIAIAAALFALILALNFTTGEKKIEQSVERLYAAADPAFARAMGVLLGPAILPGNHFEALLNGDRIFPAMLNAKKSISFESHIYWSDAIGKEFADALAERARAGVKVHVLLDWVGSNKMDPTHLAAMEAAGVEVCKFHKPAWYSLARMNNRTNGSGTFAETRSFNQLFRVVDPFRFVPKSGQERVGQGVEGRSTGIAAIPLQALANSC